MFAGHREEHMPSTDTSDSDRRQASVTYRNANHVKARYGDVSDMTLWRWLHDEELRFPQPVRINGRRLWSEDALAAWERSRGMQGPNAELEEPAVAAPREELVATELVGRLQADGEPA
jgi:predicted DNA-binding transcriptional regulator AlpA